MQATMSSKGQVTIPKPIRDQLHLNEGSKLEFSLDNNGELHVIPVTGSVTALKGMAPPLAHPVSLDDMQNAIAEGATRKVAK
jgi:AbrB family looped-hinge helix DNA binding protein